MTTSIDTGNCIVCGKRGHGAADCEKTLALTFPDQSHWSDLTIGGESIPEALHGKISYYQTDQGRWLSNVPT